jgi:hypothetical protein
LSLFTQNFHQERGIQGKQMGEKFAWCLLVFGVSATDAAMGANFGMGDSLFSLGFFLGS